MPSRAFGMRRGSAGGPRAGASLRLLNQQRARPSTSDGVSKRRPQLSAQPRSFSLDYQISQMEKE